MGPLVFLGPKGGNATSVPSRGKGAYLPCARDCERKLNQNLSALVFQKGVEARCHKKDRYGREVCAVYVARRDVGLEQIRAGMAWHYKSYQHEQPRRSDWSTGT